MKLFFISKAHTQWADASDFLGKIGRALLQHKGVVAVDNPDAADALIIHEEYSYKSWQHIDIICHDPFLSKYISKIYTINFDDSATGMFRGLYSQLPAYRANHNLHAAVAHSFYFINEKVLCAPVNEKTPVYLAAWRGNFKSGNIRKKMAAGLQAYNDCLVENTSSWWNHEPAEKQHYIDVIQQAKFSLCPRGWTPSTFRIYESMALGRCPVIIADAFDPPAGPDWNKIALFLPENRLHRLHAFLLENEQRWQEMGEAARQAFRQYFSPERVPEVYAAYLLKLIGNSEPATNEDEIRRWRSFSFQRGNGWTIPQRMVNIARRWMRKLQEQ